ncbi:MAG: molecular chaperone HtpG [Polyangiales bacterium]
MTQESHRFQAEVSQVLHLVINSLYSNREVFLRELVSNASDALDKLRFQALQAPSLLGDDPTLRVRISFDRDAGTLTIEDNGIGMTHAEVVENLGTIAHSGSRKFLEAVKARGEGSDVSLIGQFGVGFYSAYLVADRVEVLTRAAGQEEAFRWSSDAKEGFTVEPAERAERGTSITLHLREDQKDYLDTWRLRELVRKYSDFVGYPIELQKEAEDPKEGEAPAPAEFEAVNQASALWRRSKSEITREQYVEFYKHLTHGDEPESWTHFKVEGNQEFVGLLYLPKTAPYDIDVPGEKRRGLRLFVKRVFIMDDCDALLPTWLRFLRGVIDSDDLPLNVSREILQDSAVVRGIKKQVTRKALDLLSDLAKDDAEAYRGVWQNFGRVLKEGAHMEWEHRERLAELMRFESSHGDGLTSLADYASRMKEGQAGIYYLLGESRRAVADSPHLEALRAKGFEVLFLTDFVDQFVVDALREYKGKKLLSAMDAELSLGATEEEKQERQGVAEALKPLFARAASVLTGRVKEVRASDRLTDSPACLVTPPGGLNPAVERVLRAHGREVPEVKRILEVNPTHPLIQALQARVEKSGDDAQLGEWIEVLYDQALLTEGAPIENPQQFARRLTALLQQAVSS